MVASSTTPHLSVRVHLDGLPHTCATIDECLAVANRVCRGVEEAERSVQERRLAAGRVLADLKRQISDQVGYGCWERLLQRMELNPRTVRRLVAHAEAFTGADGRIDPARESQAKTIAAARFGIDPNEGVRTRATAEDDQNGAARSRASELAESGEDDEEDDGLPRRVVNGRKVFDLAALLAKPVARMSTRELDVLHRASKDEGRGPLPKELAEAVEAPKGGVGGMGGGGGGVGAMGEQMTVEDALVAMGEAARAELAELAERLGAACREHDRRRAAELGGQIKDVGARVQRLEPWT